MNFEAPPPEQGAPGGSCPGSGCFDGRAGTATATTALFITALIALVLWKNSDVISGKQATRGSPASYAREVRTWQP